MMMRWLSSSRYFSICLTRTEDRQEEAVTSEGQAPESTKIIKRDVSTTKSLVI